MLTLPITSTLTLTLTLTQPPPRWYLPLHPPHHHQDGPFLYLQGVDLHLQAGYAASATLALRAKDGAYAKELYKFMLAGLLINIRLLYQFISPESFW